VPGFDLAPSLADIDAIARAAFARLPENFRALAGDLVIRVEDFPDEEVMADLALESPFDLLGLYQGIDLAHASVNDIMSEPNMIFLYRRPILDLWCEGDEELPHLITHVLVHEIGHHFGLSDADMDAIEAAAP